jgi:hypothetical protein
MSGSYYVERIDGKKIENGKIFYNVKWDGYSSDENTWENASDLKAIHNLIDEYENANNADKIGKECKKQISKKYHKTCAKNNEKKLSKKDEKKYDDETKDQEAEGEDDFENDLIIDFTEENDLQKFAGHLIRDIPLRIISSKIKTKEKREIWHEVEWKTRYDGSKPLNSFVSNEEIKSKYPMLVLEYYETKIKTK